MSFCIITPVPERDLFRIYNAAKFNPRTRVEIIPRRIRKFFGSDDFFSICEPRTAAWLEPRPGRKAHNDDETIEEGRIEKISFDLVFSDVIFCFGRRVFCEMLVKIVDIPNNPVKRGNKGSLIA